MGHKLNTTVRNATLAALAALTMLGSGCGDGFLNQGGGMFDSVLARRMKEQMRGNEVELSEYTSCKVVASDDPETRCEGISDTKVEIFIDGQSIILDFSNVGTEGVITKSDFEGFIVSTTERSNLPPILEAVIDATMSHVDSKSLEVDFDDQNVAVNLQGLRYDQGTFIKIDLVFDEAS